MDEKRKGEIAMKLLKRFLVKENFRLGDVNNFKRELGNIAKETGIPQDELLEFTELILREILEGHLAALRPREKASE